MEEDDHQQILKQATKQEEVAEEVEVTLKEALEVLLEQEEVESLVQVEALLEEQVILSSSSHHLVTNL